MLKGTIKHIQLVIMITITFFMIYSGACKLVNYPGWPEQFEVWGYSRTIMYVVGVVEIILACLLFAKETRTIGCIGLIVFMTAALYTHISNFEYDQLYTGALIMFGSVAIIGLRMIEGKVQD